MIILVFVLEACVEPFEFNESSVDDILVVEGTLTDELKKQQILLGRAANLERVNVEGFVNNVNSSNTPEEVDTRIPEKNALVKVLDDLGNIYDFSEIEDGVYESDTSFSIVIGRSYQLKITVSTSDTFTSDFRMAAGKSQIENIYAQRILNDFDEDGMAIYVDGFDANSTLNYYRYTYEETYKIVAPNWTPYEFEIIREGLDFDQFGNPLYPAVKLVLRAQEEQVCYKTLNSTKINLGNTTLLDESVTNGNLIRFISGNDPILSHRYSILVKQYLLSLEAHAYYQNLSNFSKSDNVFSEVQPGFLEGNMVAENPKNRVLGFFDVASVSEKRLFFNYVDFFPNEELPPYFFDVNCRNPDSPPLGDPALDGPPAIECPQPLIPRIKIGIVEFFDANGDPKVCEGPYYVTPTICGDCTFLGSNIKPDFWVE